MSGTTNMKLINLAMASSGDKGDSCNVGLIARSSEIYKWLIENLTAEVVKQRFDKLCKGEVVRYLLPNMNAMNFILKNCLDGGGTVSLRADTQGKSYWAWLLKMEMEVPVDLLKTIPDDFEYLRNRYQ